jgi:hypothetical protein
MSDTAGERSDLIPSVSITAMLQRRAQLLAVLDASIQLFETGPLTGYGMSLPDVEYQLRGPNGRGVAIKPANRDAVVKQIDAGGWQYLMSNTGLRSLMDAQARKDWDNKIFACDVPELTADNIEATFRALHDARNEIFERGVLLAYQQLSWEYKTNTPVKFGSKLILSYLCDWRGKWAFFSSSSCDTLDDLSRVFHILDGQPEPDMREAGANWILNQNDSQPGVDVLFPYFTLRYFKKGTAHLRFTRPDLVDALNDILAKHYPDALPAGR